MDAWQAIKNPAAFQRQDFCTRYGIRTRVLALRGPRPGPLDESGAYSKHCSSLDDGRQDRTYHMQTGAGVS